MELCSPGLREAISTETTNMRMLWFAEPPFKSRFCQEGEALEMLSDAVVDWQYVRFIKCCTNQEEMRRKCRKESLSGLLKSKHSKPRTPRKKCNRNPNAMHVSFWEV